MKKTRKITVSSAFVALGVVLLYIGSVINVLDLTMAAIASVLVVLAVIEIGGGYSYAIYLLTALLALLLLPDKFSALLYALFAGFYPIAKAAFERLHPAVSWVLKLSLFNTGFLLLIAVGNYILHLPDTGLDFRVGVFAFANLTFVIYDVALTRLITLYVVKLRRRFGLKDLF